MTHGEAGYYMEGEILWRSTTEGNQANAKVDTNHLDMVFCLTMTANTFISRGTILPLHGIGVRTHVRR
jgi:hypothetical protein